MCWAVWTLLWHPDVVFRTCCDIPMMFSGHIVSSCRLCTQSPCAHSNLLIRDTKVDWRNRKTWLHGLIMSSHSTKLQHIMDVQCLSTLFETTAVQSMLDGGYKFEVQTCCWKTTVVTTPYNMCSYASWKVGYTCQRARAMSLLASSLGPVTKLLLGDELHHLRPSTSSVTMVRLFMQVCWWFWNAGTCVIVWII